MWGIVDKLKVSISTRQAAVLSLKSALWIWWIFFALQFLKSLISAVEGQWNLEAFSIHSVWEVKSGDNLANTGRLMRCEKARFIFWTLVAAMLGDWGVKLRAPNVTNWCQRRGRGPELGTVSREQTAVLLDFVQMKGWGKALPKFFVTFSYVHFWSIIGVYFLQNANNLDFKLFVF